MLLNRQLIWSFVILLLSFQRLIEIRVQKEAPRKLVDDPEEYLVYAKLLSEKYSRTDIKSFVITVDTISTHKGVFFGIRGGWVGTGDKRPEVEADTSTSFDARNDDSFQLARKLDLKIPYTLVTEEELSSLFPKKGEPIDGDCWKRFYQKYPNSPGVIAFSRVGFNSKKSQALVYVISQSGLVGGANVFYVLAKQSGSWEIEKQVVVVLS